MTGDDRCPVSDCDGRIAAVVTGTRYNPRTSIEATCGHALRQCNGCNSYVRDRAATAWRYVEDPATPGTPDVTTTAYFCPDCDGSDYTPAHAAERGQEVDS
jgi:hypothetical protein